jgi:hypothetical protein
MQAFQDNINYEVLSQEHIITLHFLGNHENHVAPQSDAVSK